LRKTPKEYTKPYRTIKRFTMLFPHQTVCDYISSSNKHDNYASLLLRREIHKAIRAVKREPSNREIEGFVTQQTGTHRIEPKIIPYQESFVNSKIFPSIFIIIKLLLASLGKELTRNGLSMHICGWNGSCC